MLLLFIVSHCRLCQFFSVRRHFDSSAGEKFWLNDSVPVVMATKVVRAAPSSTGRPFSLAGARLYYVSISLVVLGAANLCSGLTAWPNGHYWHISPTLPDN